MPYAHRPITNQVADSALTTCTSINELPFGISLAGVLSELGEPDRQARNYTGEEELLYGDRIYRCLDNRFVEATFPDAGQLTVDGVVILKVFDWLGSLPNAIDVARFRISLEHGLAYDYRDLANGSIFEAGHWDRVVAQAAPASDE